MGAPSHDPDEDVDDGTEDDRSGSGTAREEEATKESHSPQAGPTNQREGEEEKTGWVRHVIC